MILELKHLAPYLPYGLKSAQHTYHIDKPLISDVTHYNLDRLIDGNSNAKILLRTLSDLTKPIEINGNKFVPLDWINENWPNCERFFEWQKGYPQDIVNLNDSIVEWCVVDKLISWHFDIFNLLENNLAIDINTIEI